MSEYEPAFDIGDQVHVCDPIHGIPYEQGEIDAVHNTDLTYDVVTEDGRRFEYVPEVQLEEVEAHA